MIRKGRRRTKKGKKEDGEEKGEPLCLVVGPSTQKADVLVD